MIFKSLSGVRSIVRPLERSDLSRLELVKNCPTQFQEIVEGVDIRVHTVGREIFATEIRSSASDYRYAATFRRVTGDRDIDIPPGIADACIGLANACGLTIAGIDLRRTPDGRYYCFEVNPSPGFIFYERATGSADQRGGGSTAARRFTHD